MHVVDFVVSSHDTPRSSSFDSNHEWHQVDLPQSAVSDDGADSHTLMLLVIADKVFETCCNVFFLNAVAVRASQNTREQGIFGVRLKSTATQWATLDVDRGTENDVGALCFCLIREEVANALDKLWVEC